MTDAVAEQHIKYLADCNDKSVCNISDLTIKIGKDDFILYLLERHCRYSVRRGDG